MDIMEIVLLVAGGIVFVLSFLIPAKKRESSEEARGLAKEEIKTLVSEELEAVRGHVDDVVEEAVTYSIEKTERSLERLSNEKIMAVNEYSDTVLAEIHKNHEEVMFLYDMLNDKHANLKNTVSEINRTVKEAKETKKEAEEVVNTFQRLAPDAIFPLRAGIMDLSSVQMAVRRPDILNASVAAQEVTVPQVFAPAPQTVQTPITVVPNTITPEAVTPEPAEAIALAEIFSGPGQEPLSANAVEKPSGPAPDLAEPSEQAVPAAIMSGGAQGIMPVNAESTAQAAPMPELQIPVASAEAVTAESPAVPVPMVSAAILSGPAPEPVSMLAAQQPSLGRGLSAEPPLSPGGISFTQETDGQGRNYNDRILEMYQNGKSKVAIAKELNLGVGEVKLVIDLYKNRSEK